VDQCKSYNADRNKGHQTKCQQPPRLESTWFTGDTCQIGEDLGQPIAVTALRFGIRSSTTVLLRMDPYGMPQHLPLLVCPGLCPAV